MSRKKVARFFVDSQNFLSNFWPESAVWRVLLREVDWLQFERVITRKVGADYCDRIYYYDAFPGGQIPVNLREFSEEAWRLIGQISQDSPKFVIRSGFIVRNRQNTVLGNSSNRLYREKCVDTQMAVDMTHGACLDEYDTAVLFSADLDMLPAIVQVVNTGRSCVVCGWGQRGMSVDLMRYIDETPEVQYLELEDLGHDFVRRALVKHLLVELGTDAYVVMRVLCELFDKVRRGVCASVTTEDVVENDRVCQSIGLTRGLAALDFLVKNEVILLDSRHLLAVSRIRPNLVF